MKLLVVLTVLVLSSLCGHVQANERADGNRFESSVAVLGPVSVTRDQNMKVCSTDMSIVAKLGAKGQEKPLSRRYHTGRRGDAGSDTKEAWSSTRVEVFDSTDTTRPLPVPVDDLIFASGKGACANIAGYEINAAGASRSVVIVLTTVTEAKAGFSPVATGQLSAPIETSSGLLLPAVQSAGSGSSGSGGGQCCACAPVCGCGICD